MAALRDRIEEHSQRPTSATARPSSTPGARRAPRSSTPTASCSACRSCPASSPRSRPGSPRSPAAACSAPRSTPRRASATGSIYADERVVVVCPFWSAVPYEMLVIPRAHSPHLYKSPTDDLVSVGRALRALPGPTARRVGDVAYNIVFHSAPYRVQRAVPLARPRLAQGDDPGRLRDGHRRRHQHRRPRVRGRRAPGRRARPLSTPADHAR